jgi:ADP-ribose pyrophosphatase
MVRSIYAGRVVTLNVERVTLPNGTSVDLELVRHPGAAAVAAVDGDGRVVLISQYRYAAGGFVWELPAGVLDHPGEPPVECAARELREETGLGAGRLSALGQIMPTFGYSDERIHLFLAEELTDGAHAQANDEVIREIRRVPLHDALGMVRAGEVVDAKTVAGLYLAAARLGVTA